MMTIAVMLPLVALHGYTLYRQYQSAQADAIQTVSRHSTDSAKTVAEWLARTETLLTLLSARAGSATPGPLDCGQMLHGLASIDPLYLSLVVARLDGRVVCRQESNAGGTGTSFQGLSWFREAVDAGRAHLSPPLQASLADVTQQVSMLSVPLRNPQGEPIGIAALAIDLPALAEHIKRQGLPDGSSITLVNAESLVLTRFPDSSQWIGKPTPRSVQAARAKTPHGVVFVAGPDGITRAYATSPVGRHELRLAVGIPAEVIFASPRAAQRQSYLVATATLCLAILLSLLAGRSLARPIVSLSRTAKAWAMEVPGTRADEKLPGEFSKLACEFNHMIDAREASEARLAESERRYAAMLDGVDMVAINLDTNDRLLYCNDALLRLTGWSRTEVLGEPWSRRFLPAEHHGQTEALLASLAPDQGEPADTLLPARHENEILTRSGQRRLMRWANAPLRAADGHLIGMSCIGEDITERQEAERVRQARLEADTANKAKTEFLARMSHELRTPLNAVLGFSQLLQVSARARLETEQQQQLDLIYLGGMQLRSIVNDVLDLSQIESGRLSINRAPVWLHSLLDSVVHLSEPQAGPAGIHLVRDYAEAPPLRLHTDEVRLRQVLLNLVSNSIKYNHPGGTVSIGFSVDAGELRLRVEDNGLGMTPEQLAQLFQPFNRLGREHGQVAGSGIGMALSLQLVRLMGGEMTVESRPSQGTRVHVLLSKVLAAPESTGPSAPLLPGPASPSLEAGTASPGGVVLYIEDNQANALLVQELLSRWPDVHLRLAEDGEEGLRQATARPPDLILLDMQLPDLQGLDVLRQLRAHPATAHLPVVALSANAMPQEIEIARRAGATDYWTKPINFPAFLAGLAALLPAVD